MKIFHSVREGSPALSFPLHLSLPLLFDTKQQPVHHAPSVSSTLLAAIATPGKATITVAIRTSRHAAISSAANLNNLLNRAKAASHQLSQASNISKERKAEISTIINKLIQATTQLFPQTTTTKMDIAMQTDKPTVIVNEMDLKAVNKKINLIVNILMKEKTWTQIIASTLTLAAKQLVAVKQRFEKARKDQTQYEVTLTMTDALDRIYELIKSTPHKGITDSLQKTIDKVTLEGKPPIEGINKLGRGMIHLRAATKEGAKTIRDASIEWKDAYPRLKVYKLKYSVVIHRVPTETIGWDANTCTQTKDELQKQNAKSNIIITSIRPLCKARKQHKPPSHQSIVVYTEDGEAADRYIQIGFLVDR